jgi:signal peptidase I
MDYPLGSVSGVSSEEDVILHLVQPDRWHAGDMFDTRREVSFVQAADQFFVMGDNSPASQDGRLWSQPHRVPHYVERNMLIGEAVFVYWPHPLLVRVPFTERTMLPWFPNFREMEMIH